MHIREILIKIVSIGICGSIVIQITAVRCESKRWITESKKGNRNSQQIKSQPLKSSNIFDKNQLQSIRKSAALFHLYTTCIFPQGNFTHETTSWSMSMLMCDAYHRKRFVDLFPYSNLNTVVALISDFSIPHGFCFFLWSFLVGGKKENNIKLCTQSVSFCL